MVPRGWPVKGKVMPKGHGSTNENGGYVKEKPVSPADLSATILHHLGIDPQQTWPDEFQTCRGD